MVKYNIYKIEPDKRNKLIEKLKSVGLIKASSRDINGYTIDFYFSNESDEIDIWWTDVYKDFFKNLEPPKNKIYFATLLIYNSSICYAVSLGKSHFYLKNFCDLDFGLNLAERIADDTNIKIKNSKKSRKNKIITTYQEGSSIDFDSGESMHYIKAKTINAEKWGKTASFGHSAQFNIEISPDNLPDFIKNIEEVLQEEPQIKLPKVFAVQDEDKQDELDDILADTILRNTDNKSDVTVDDVSLSGVDFIFSDQNEYSFYLKGKARIQTEKGDLSLDKLKGFLETQNIDLKQQINDIKIKIHNEYGRDYSKSLKDFLDFVEERERYCLIDGRWYQFNQSYIDFLKTEVDKIDFEIKDIEVAESNEDEFNKNKSDEGFINCHKIIDSIDKKYKVEKIDLYKDERLYFVKFGTPQGMNYVIDQSVNTVRLLQNNQSRREIDGDEKEVNGICLWLVFRRKNKIKKISEINSLIFHMKLVDWKKIVQNSGYKPLILINYKKL
jgi:uncharacterized protein (TIGR04141 family)